MKILSLRFIRRVSSSNQHSSAAAAAKPVISRSEAGTVKTIDDLPGPPRIPGYGSPWLLQHSLNRNKREKMTQHTSELVEKYGKFVRLSMGAEKTVAIACPKVVEEVYRTQDKGLPIRRIPVPWMEYFKESGRGGGLGTSQKEEWKKKRLLMNSLVLKPRSFDSYALAIQEIVREFSNSLPSQSDQSGFVENLTAKLARLSHEVAAQVAFGVRLNCMVEPDERAKKFVESVMCIIGDITNWVGAFANIMRKFNTRGWRKHKESWDTILETTEALIDEALANKDKFEKTGYVPLVFLILDKAGDQDDPPALMSDIFSGGVDTSSNTVGFLLYNLANNPEKQDKLREEVMSMGDRKHESRYMRKVLKESLRMYPTAPRNLRTIEIEFTSQQSGISFKNGDEVILLHSVIGRDPNNFTDAHEFIPERFDRDNTTPKSDKGFLLQPFGFGVRSCIGRRLAEIQISITIAEIISKYKLELVPGMKLDPIDRAVLTPGDQVPVRFTKLP